MRDRDEGEGYPGELRAVPDEGHGFARPQSSTSFYAVAEAFLAAHLGGRLEPLTPADFEGSTMEVLEGAGELPGIVPGCHDGPAVFVPYAAHPHGWGGGPTEIHGPPSPTP